MRKITSKYYLLLSVIILITVSKNSFSQTNKYIDSLLNVVKTVPDTQKIELNYKIGAYYYNNELFVKSISYGNKILAIYDTLKIKLKTNYKSKAFEIIGKSYYSMDFYSKALDASSKALLFAKEEKDTSGIIVILLDLGNIYEGIDNNKLANKYYYEVIRYANLVNDKYNLSLGYNNLGIIQSNINQPDSALYYYNLSIKLKKETLGYGDAVSYINISDIYREGNELDSAKKYLNLALITPDINKESLYLTIIYHDYCLIYIKENNLTKAEEYILKSLRISKEKQFNSPIISAYRALYDIYKKKKDYKTALVYHEKYANANDSLLKINQESHISYVELLYETEKQDLKIAKLNTEDELKSLRITALEHKQIAFIIGIIIIFLVALLFFIQNYRIKTAYRKIVDENVKNTDYKTEIKKLKKELNKSLGVLDNNQKITEEKYSDSPLSEEQKKLISEKILRILEDDKIYLDINLKLSDFSEKIGINKTYVSQVLNEELNIGFSEIINQCRIDEAKKLLIDESNNNITIEAIAQEAGFKSSSTFNRVFKNETGVTPSFFLKSVRKSKSK